MGVERRRHNLSAIAIPDVDEPVVAPCRDHRPIVGVGDSTDNVRPGRGGERVGAERWQQVVRVFGPTSRSPTGCHVVVSQTRAPSTPTPPMMIRVPSGDTAPTTLVPSPLTGCRLVTARVVASMTATVPSDDGTTSSVRLALARRRAGSRRRPVRSGSALGQP